VQEVDATTNAIIELGGQLAAEGIEKVTIESTSDYWRPFFYLLEAAGLAVQLVNAHDVKNAPGRPKTDKLDAVWLAKLTERGHAAALLRSPGRDPAAARLHPAAHRLDPRPRPALAAAGEAAGRRAD
jgi:transposase